MRFPLEIKTRHMSLGDSMEDEIRDRAERLEHFYGRITRCRVTVEAPGGHRGRERFQVRVDLHVPGAEIVVNRQKGTDPYVAIRDAFNAVTRRLEDYVRRRRGYVKTHGESGRAWRKLEEVPASA